MTSVTVGFRFGKVGLENLCLKRRGTLQGSKLNESFVFSFVSPTVCDGNKWCFCVWKITWQYSLMVKNLEIKPSFFYFPHGILRDLHIDLKTTT